VQTSREPRPQFLKAVALACLVAGTLDLSDAFIFYGLRGTDPHRILQGIASGVLGRAAFIQGTRSALLGLLLLFFIAATWAAIYIFASRRLPLSRHPLLWGSLYGIVVYLVMNYVVIPLSKIGPRPTPPLIPLINGVAALIFFIGIPAALIARRYIPYKIS
jgi:drug/metabolite transporter (DMT)-like permease